FPWRSPRTRTNQTTLSHPPKMKKTKKKPVKSAPKRISNIANHWGAHRANLGKLPVAQLGRLACWHSPLLPIRADAGWLLNCNIITVDASPDAIVRKAFAPENEKAKITR
ncbi:MAG TPA: hypothetical protein VHI52_01080, partial [Verrucomicrobiae bacterium]|nr:hypothetical protein [Verrucomicrobiae bacterium]